MRLADGSFAQCVGRPSPTEVELVRLMPDPAARHQLLLGDEPTATIKLASVAAHANIDEMTSLRAHRRAWRTVGLRLAITSIVGPDVFVPLEGVPDDALVAVGDDDDDSDDDESPPSSRPGMHGYVSDDGFVVPDDAPFTQGDPDESEFVADTHAAVAAFADWVPTTAKGNRYRDYVESLERKYVHLDDNAQFNAGTRIASYARPPQAKARANKKRRTSGS